MRGSSCLDVSKTDFNIYSQDKVYVIVTAQLEEDCVWISKV